MFSPEIRHRLPVLAHSSTETLYGFLSSTFKDIGESHVIEFYFN